MRDGDSLVLSVVVPNRELLASLRLEQFEPNSETRPCFQRLGNLVEKRGGSCDIVLVEHSDKQLFKKAVKDIVTWLAEDEGSSRCLENCAFSIACFLEEPIWSFSLQMTVDLIAAMALLRIPLDFTIYVGKE